MLSLIQTGLVHIYDGVQLGVAQEWCKRMTDKESGQKRALSPEAKRALAEAEERRIKREAEAKDRPAEVNGRGGLDPARYDDWEVKGIASDF